MRALFLFIILLLISNISISQKFWLTTYSFPGGYKYDIERINDSLILVATDNSLLLSRDQGYSWEENIITNGINCIYYSKYGRTFLGGSGKVFYSDDLINWDSVLLPTGNNVLQFIENNSALYLITGGFNSVQGYVGDGIYKSNDNGLTWSRKNQGLGNILSSQFISVDKYNRLYVAFADNNVSQQSGLYVSSDNAESWQRIEVKVDGKGAISSEPLRIEDFTNLTITNDDSIIISFDGIADNVGVRLNLNKHIDDVFTTNFWSVVNVYNTSMWWMDRSMGLIHISRNGDRYSSLSGTLNTGGSLFLKKNSSIWFRHQYGLGLDYNGLFNTQKFIELNNGKVFMIQYGDERVYWTDTSAITNVEDIRITNTIIYPNPISINNTLNIKFDNSNYKKIEIYNLNSQLIYNVGTTDAIMNYKFENVGLYIIKINEGKISYSKKIIVN